MEQVSRILGRIASPEPTPPEDEEVPAWRRAAEAAHWIALNRRQDPASLA